MLGLCSLPIEVLREILFDVNPTDLVTLASSSRYLCAVVASIDFRLALHHIKQLQHVDARLVQRNLMIVPFNNQLLFEHSVAAISHFRINARNAECMWGQRWQSLKMDQDEEWIRHFRVFQLRTAVQRRLWPSTIDPAGKYDSLGDVEVDALQDAFEMAGLMRSLDLLFDLRNAFPGLITSVFGHELLMTFFFASANVGYCDGLSLLPPNTSVLHETNRRGATLLGLASASLNAPAVKLLLEKGAPVNPVPTGHRSKPPLFFALEEDNLEILQLLVQHGADLNSRYRGDTALHRAAAKGRPEVVKLLLEFGADIEALNEDGLTPLCAAARKGRCECMDVLLDAGANVDAVDSEDEKSALSWACADGRLDAVRLLIARGASVNPASSPFPPLYEAAGAQRDHLDVVKTLLEAGADVNSINWRGETPLYQAMDKGRAGLAMLLLDAGADPTIKCNSGSSPLGALPVGVTWSTEWDVLLDRIVEKGLDLHEKNVFGRTIWHGLCEAGLENPGFMHWVLRYLGYDPAKGDDYHMIWEAIVAEVTLRLRQPMNN
ncbi:hypothetical protein HDU96_001012 [Phlyctochytrium bullatum]|nr:hypothetical protein HDU96_001012 [Phlyctochytrium bullatum]